MEIGAVGSTFGSQPIAGSRRVESASLTQQDFLMLMIEQMRQQNPLEPMENTDFIAQMAQFDTLTAMHDISEALLRLASVSELSNASALVGRTVTAIVPRDPDPVTGAFREPELVSGEVERVTFDDSGTVVIVDGRRIPAELIAEVA